MSSDVAVTEEEGQETERDRRIKLSQSSLSILTRVRKGYITMDKKPRKETSNDAIYLALAESKRGRRRRRNLRLA